MGIVNNDSIDTAFGTSVTGSYLAIGPNSIMIEREVDFETEAVTYKLNTIATMWVDKAARDSNKRSIGLVNINKTLTEDELAQGGYVVAYNILKDMFPNNSDS
jgi:hypothetical protein